MLWSRLFVNVIIPSLSNYCCGKSCCRFWRIGCGQTCPGHSPPLLLLLLLFNWTLRERAQRMAGGCRTMHSQICDTDPMTLLCLTSPFVNCMCPETDPRYAASYETPSPSPSNRLTCCGCPVSLEEDRQTHERFWRSPRSRTKVGSARARYGTCNCKILCDALDGQACIR